MSIAAERVERLAALAERATREGEPALARERVRTAKRIAERHRLELPTRFKRFTCDACDAWLVPGRNCRVRVGSGAAVYACDCGELARYPY
jgi:ribonuclease P protein subunit RPR2